jgi:hypothetical protein
MPDVRVDGCRLSFSVDGPKDAPWLDAAQLSNVEQAEAFTAAVVDCLAE